VQGLRTMPDSLPRSHQTTKGEIFQSVEGRDQHGATGQMSDSNITTIGMRAPDVSRVGHRQPTITINNTKEPTVDVQRRCILDLN
jgi:hypothetical protein